MTSKNKTNLSCDPKNYVFLELLITRAFIQLNVIKFQPAGIHFFFLFNLPRCFD